MTPSLPGDDFTPNAILVNGWNIGDSDHDNLLDPGEAWYYTWTTLVTEGQHVNVATAAGTPVGGGTTVTDVDPACWVGVSPPTASLGNFVWQDLDKDGIQDTGEAGVKGVIVDLLDAGGVVVASTTTDAGGLYRFTGLAAGSYAVDISSKNFVCGGALKGWQATLENQGSNEALDSDGDPLTHRSGLVILAAGGSNPDIDFGFYVPGGCSTGKGNNGVGNGLDPQPPGNPPINDGPGTTPGNPGNRGGGKAGPEGKDATGPGAEHGSSTNVTLGACAGSDAFSGARSSTSSDSSPSIAPIRIFNETSGEFQAPKASMPLANIVDFKVSRRTTDVPAIQPGAGNGSLIAPAGNDGTIDWAGSYKLSVAPSDAPGSAKGNGKATGLNDSKGNGNNGAGKDPAPPPSVSLPISKTPAPAPRTPPAPPVEPVKAAVPGKPQKK